MNIPPNALKAARAALEREGFADDGAAVALEAAMPHIGRDIAAVTAERDKLRAELDDARGLMARCLSAVRDASNLAWMEGAVGAGQEYADLADDVMDFLARTEPKGTP